MNNMGSVEKLHLPWGGEEKALRVEEDAFVPKARRYEEEGWVALGWSLVARMHEKGSAHRALAMRANTVGARIWGERA